MNSTPSRPHRLPRSAAAATRPRLRLLTALGAGLALVACVAAPPTVTRSRSVRLHFVAGAGEHVKFEQAHRVRLACVGPDGKRVEATGEAGPSDTIAALCRSLQGSLQSRGVGASYRASAPEAPRERQALEQVLELDAGWLVTLPVQLENVNGGDIELAVVASSP